MKGGRILYIITCIYHITTIIHVIMYILLFPLYISSYLSQDMRRLYRQYTTMLSSPLLSNSHDCIANPSRRSLR